MKAKKEMPLPQPTESEAIVAALRAPQTPATPLVAPVPLPVDQAGNLASKPGFKASWGAVFLSLALFLGSGCHEAAPRAAELGEGLGAVCDLSSTDAGTVLGHATFVRHRGYMHIEVTMRGLKPGKHGIHVHEFADCSDGAKKAGGHFNPTGQMHGMPADEHSHLGDLGNISAGADGRATLSLDDPYMRLEGADSILGRSLVVHADPDDMKTQPSGDSGDRIACGLIEMVKP